MLILSFINTRFFTNSWGLITNSSNYIPKDSNVFIFIPTKIDSGSGEYWRYGKDYKNYYYFSEKEENIYYMIAKKSDCQDLNSLDYLTWCKAIKKKQ